jgi:hypothetical protein
VGIDALPSPVKYPVKPVEKYPELFQVGELVKVKLFPLPLRSVQVVPVPG